METWKDIEGCKGYYQASDYGRIRTVDREITYCNGRVDFYKGRVLKLTPRSSGENSYLCVDLCINNKHKLKSVHKIIAETFIPNPENKKTVNHKNGLKHDNRVYNLEWNTIKENNNHALKNGLRDNKTKKILCSNGEVFESSFKAAEWLNSKMFKHSKVIKTVARRIRGCCNNEHKIAYGLKWNYID